MAGMLESHRNTGFTVSIARNTILLVCLAMLFPLLQLAAQTQYPENMSLNGGTLSWIATFSSGACGEHGSGSYGQVEYSNFVYSYSYPSTFNTSPQEYIPVSVPLIGQVGYIYGSSGLQLGCPPNGPQPAGGAPIMDSTNFYRVYFTPVANGQGSATMENFTTGGVGPQYVILNVIYAPPGPGGTNSLGPSTVNYSNSTAFGTNTSMSNSFTDSSVYTTQIGFPGLTIGGSVGWTQQAETSSSLAVNKSSTLSEIYTGVVPANVVGLDHDNDTINVWLNPAINCTAEEEWTVIPAPAAIQCLIYDPEGIPGDRDDPLMDTVQLPVGELNGDYNMQTLDPDTYQILLNHGITSADFLALAQADPYYQCAASISCVQNAIGLNSTRFDLNTDPGIIHFQPSGNSTPYTIVYGDTTTQGQQASASYSVSNSVNGSDVFLSLWNENVKYQNTLTWTDQWSETTTNTTTQTVTLTINEPTGSYGGPTQFEVYKDNVYQTFMLYPTQ
jgi:hypothetical protein